MQVLDISDAKAVIGLTGKIGQSNYAASKACIIGLTKSIAKELSLRNINVNAICPAPTFTDIVEKLIKTRASEQKKSKEEIIKTTNDKK